jgi:diguanylate cyclase (GGDEF)-like protein
MAETPETLLVIDDAPDHLSLLINLLTEQGFETLIAPEGNEGLNIARYAQPDLILLDVLMPDLDGIQVCHALKQDPKTEHIPVIFLTAVTDSEQRLACFAAGGADFINKPVEQAEALARIKIHLKISRLQKKLLAQNQQLQHTNELLMERTASLERLTIQLKLENHERQLAEQALGRMNQELAELAMHDALTALANRRRFDDYLTQEWYRMAREKLPLAIILCDVDYFKLYNDNYGHQAGDDCLFQIAQSLYRSLRRPADLAARYGGEEFALVLPNTEQKGALTVGHNVRRAIQQLKIQHSHSGFEYVSLSLGLSCTIPTVQHQPTDLLMAADHALYEAKRRGRNQLIFQSFETFTQTMVSASS